jgi:tRNA(fMet)-specific endonuclease VapC
VPFLDTTVLIDLMRTRDKVRHAQVTELLSRLESAEDPRTISRFTIAELLIGVERCDDPDVQRRKVERVLTGIAVREFDEDAMQMYPKIAAHIFNIGKPIGVMDMLIASVAIVSGQALLTRNARHFEDIPGLSVIAYA